MPSTWVVASRPFNYAGEVKAAQPYVIYSSGRWVDRDIPADGRGYASRGAMRYFERLRRHPDAAWFSLIGVVAERVPGRSHLRIVEGPTDLGVRLGQGAWTPAHGGHLFLFANDVSVMYGNNRGALNVRLVAVPR